MSTSVLRAVAAMGAAIWVVACSGSPDADEKAPGSGGASKDTGGSTLLDVLLRHNEVHVAALERHCELCGCGGIVGGDPETHVCVDRVVREGHASLAEPLRSLYECLIPLAEEKLACFQSASDCPAIEACANAAEPDEAACEDLLNVETEAYADLTADVQTQCGDG